MERQCKGIKEQYPYLALSLSGKLKNYLEIKALKQKVNPEFSEAFTNSPKHTGIILKYAVYD